MSGSTVSPRRMRVSFGVFELDLRTGELRKAGNRVRLSGQPVTVLARLVERPGELVTREELRRELWSGDTFVDFERNLNSAIKRLRAALGDSGQSPRFIETLPRRGYRFLLPVRYVDDPADSVAGVRRESADHRASATPRARWKWSRPLGAAAALTLSATVLVALVALPRPAREPDGGASRLPAAALAPAVETADRPDVALAYLRGRYHLAKGNEADFSRARRYFEEALALDPSHAPSHAGLADYFTVTDALPPAAAFSSARQYARQALALDKGLPDAHTSLAFVHFYADWDWEAAERAFQSALALDGRHSRALRWYGLFLSAMGRHDEAIEHVEAAIAIDPLAIVNHDAAATIQFAARDYEASTRIGRAISELDGFDVRAYEHQGLGLVQLGQAPAALALAERGLSITGPSVVLELIRTLSLARMGQRDAAIAASARMEQGTGSAEVSAVFSAIALAALGVHDRAIEELERAYAGRDPYLVLLRGSPWFDPLREDSRFQRLYARMHFPQGRARGLSPAGQ
jgi:DNA-binding winged helix-turn-helix (wHTH) protein/Tfp pilus assembly protein PilF